MAKQRLLMIAFHYPPLKGSSGIQRTLKFSQYLSEMGWDISVVSAHPRAYPQISDEQMNEIPGDIKVCRAFALDTARHLSVRGRYLGLLALPDRWVSWCVGIVYRGLLEIKRCRPNVLWSTYPLASATLGALLLQKLTGIPWVLDLRDSMVDEDYPHDPMQRRIFKWLEARAVKRATRVVLTTPSAARMYAERYPRLPVDKWKVIRNGYDEDNFSAVSAAAPIHSSESQPIVMVHSGLLYPSERNPIPFFDALSELKKENHIDANRLRIILRASGHDDYFRPLIEQRGIAEIVKLESSIPYQAALSEMLQADALLLLQAKNCNHLIPAKLYEYLRARRPIFALTDHAGDTASTMREVGVNTIASLDNKEEIKTALCQFLIQLKNNEAPVADDSNVHRFSRRSLSKSLADLLLDLI
ncbi:MAG: glycosyltransferase [Gammaproteobacteria bacterium]|nr:glycosyltransferase [Gammaproteobacteria bacterium]